MPIKPVLAQISAISESFVENIFPKLKNHTARERQKNEKLKFMADFDLLDKTRKATRNEKNAKTK